jgi:N-acetylneuraminate synthase
VVKDIKAGEAFTAENVRSIRPANGLHTRYYDQILQSHASCDIEAGTALEWGLIASS